MRKCCQRPDAIIPTSLSLSLLICEMGSSLLSSSLRADAELKRENICVKCFNPRQVQRKPPEAVTSLGTASPLLVLQLVICLSSSVSELQLILPSYVTLAKSLNLSGTQFSHL